MPKISKIEPKKIKTSVAKSKSNSVKGKSKPDARAGKQVIDRVELDAAVEMLRPALQSHGGDLAVVAVDRDEVTVRLTGACHGCPMAQITLTQGVEKFLVKQVKGLRRVKSA